MDKVRCRGCGFTGEIGDFLPAFSLYNDCRCPKCRTTDVTHNDEYRSAILRGMSSLDREDAECDEGSRAENDREV